jgi:hypothetical protein
MGRRSHAQPLALWVNGEWVGHWTPVGPVQNTTTSTPACIHLDGQLDINLDPQGEEFWVLQ